MNTKSENLHLILQSFVYVQKVHHAINIVGFKGWYYSFMDFIKSCKYQLIMLSQINRNSFDVLVRALPTTIRSEVMLGSF